MSTAATALTPVGVLPSVKPKRAPVNKWLVTLSITFGTLMGTIDASIINVAISHIRGTVGATVEEITWISTGFALANVLVMPLTAFLGRMFGQKRLYMACLVIFLVGSMLCGLATSLNALIFFRVIQGLGAGALQPTEQAILRQTFSPKEQGMAMALFGLAIMIGPAIGPTLGGYIVDNYSWPWIFYINLPVGILGLYMVSQFVHEPDDVLEDNRRMAAEQRKHFDLAGIVLLSVGMASLQYVLEEGNSKDWFQSRLITGLTLTAVFSILGFIIVELQAKVPAVNLRLFKDSAFAAGTVVGAIMFSMLMSLTFLLPVFMQELLGFTSMQSGLALMPRTLVMMFFMPIIGKFYNKLPGQLLVLAGLGTFSVSGYMLSHVNLATSTSNIVAALCIQGLAFSFLMVPLNTVALASIPRLKMTDATGLNSLVRQIGGSLGLAVFVNLLSTNATIAKAAVGAHLVATRPEVMARVDGIANGLMGRGIDPATAQAFATMRLNGMAAQQGMVIAFDKLFLLAGLLFIAIMPLVIFLKPPKTAGPIEKAEVHVEI
jgi:DHA2 family multidrug resistance protein